MHFTTNLSQQSLRKLATNRAFTVDQTFSDRIPWKASRRFELDFCCLQHQLKPLNKKINDSPGNVMKTLYNY